MCEEYLVYFLHSKCLWVPHLWRERGGRDKRRERERRTERKIERQRRSRSKRNRYRRQTERKRRPG